MPLNLYHINYKILLFAFNVYQIVQSICIARTELAFGYNAGAYGATKDAQAQGYIGDCKKVWLTAYDKRVCPICAKMDGEKRNMDEHFSNGKLLPPAHPHCRCAVAYEEINNEPLTDDEKNDIISLGSDNVVLDTLDFSEESINGGAFSGAKKTPGWQERHGERMYEEIRHRTTDVKKISTYTAFTESAVNDIKQHMFFKKHRFADGSVKRFDSDFDQAQAWDRLSQGKGTETDIEMLKHEYVELTQMRLYNYDYETAHTIANKKHNWWAMVCEED